MTYISNFSLQYNLTFMNKVYNQTLLYEKQLPQDTGCLVVNLGFKHSDYYIHTTDYVTTDRLTDYTPYT